LGFLFKKTKLFRSRNNVIIQTGLKINELKIIPQNAIFSHPQHLKNHRTEIELENIKKLCDQYEFDFTSDQVLWNFDVLIHVSPNFH